MSVNKEKFNINNYLDIEAEEGSDNEEHDDIVKKPEENKEDIKASEEQSDLEGLINYKLDEKINLKELRNKFNSEQLDKDKEDIRKVILHEHKPKRKWSDFNTISQDDTSLIKRKKMSLIPNETFHFEITMKDKHIANISKMKRILKENASQEGEFFSDEEKNPIKDLLEYQQDIKSDLFGKSGAKKELKKRQLENKEILKSVINLNDVKQCDNKERVKNRNGHNQFMVHHKISIINAIKNDKYNDNKIYPKSDQMKHKEIIKENDKNKNIRNFPMFKNNTHITGDSDKKVKISEIFNSSDLSHKININNKI